MYKQGVLDKATVKKEAIIAKKAVKAAKPSRIVILRVGSTILASLRSYKAIEVEKSGVLIIVAL
jgi:hypothetical protein